MTLLNIKLVAIVHTHSIKLSRYFSTVFSFSSCMVDAFRKSGNLTIRRARWVAPHTIDGSIGVSVGTICQASTFCRMSRNRIDMPMPSGSRLRRMLRLENVSVDCGVELLPELLLTTLGRV